MTHHIEPTEELAFLSGGGEMGQRIRSLDWANTPLGPPGLWSPTLKMMVSFLLANRFPMLLWWGPQYIQLYNDAYRPVLGSKHPRFLGKPVHECWSEIWQVLQPLIDTPFHGGPATWMEDLELEIRRRGFTEESHFTVAYSPVPDDTAPRGIGGVLATVHEITEKVIAQRRVAILRELGAGVAEVKSAENACQSAAEILGRHPKDVPFAVVYLSDPDGCGLQRICEVGISAIAAGPAHIDLTGQGSPAPWPLLEGLHSETLRVIPALPQAVRASAHGPWSDPPEQAVLVPIKSNVPRRPAGALVLGVSSRIALDPEYLTFLELLTSQVATTIANAQAYEAERRRAEVLMELDRAKTTFFSNISHEFRTPLTLMLGPLEELMADPRLNCARAELELAHRNSLRLLKLVNTLLDFSRIEAGRVQASYEPTNLAELTRDLASTFRAAIERAGLRFEVDCQDLGEPVYVDREMWEKVVLNLLSNAFKFTLEGAIAVRLLRMDAHAVLEVSDTGVGVPEHEVPRLFERFHRVEGSAGRTHEGSGIGLALVQELLRLHGATIQVSSTLGRGTSFRVQLAFGADHLPADRIKAARSLASTAIGAQAFVQEALRWIPGSSEGSAEVLPTETDVRRLEEDQRFASTAGARIVLADDNADMRAYVAGLLRPMYRVEVAADGEEALAIARRERPDLILSDVMMPQLDGLGLMKAIRADELLREVPFVLLSARAGEEARIEGFEAGADDYVVKPFTARELLARVGALLELARVRREAVQKLDREKDEFLAMLSHELRNPLAPLTHASELLSRSLPKEAAAQGTVGVVKRQISQLTRLVDDLLDVSRITLGRIQLKSEPLDLTQVIEQAVETVEPLLREKQLQLQMTAYPEPIHVNGDSARLVQCVVNILTNAVKYTDAGGTIRVVTRSEGALASIEVSDTGAGIPEDLLPRIFDLFVQSARTLDRAQGGLGIGLSVVKRLVEMHGGRIRANSAGPGTGSRFEIRLPCIAPPEPARSSSPVAQPTPRRVLIVDDNADAADSLALLLSFEGHQAEAVYSAREALEKIESFKPDVALLDIGLPQVDGYELARRLRALPLPGGLKLVAVTGYGQAEDRERTREAGFDEHLVKPVDLPAIERALAGA